MTAVAGLLLTGGRSRRLGVDKANLVVDGTTLADRNGRMLGEVCDPALEVGGGHSALPALREEPPGSGPLAALAAGGDALAARGHRGAAVLLAVDLPAMTTACLELLRDWPGEPTVVPVLDGRPQLVCARYGADALVAAASLVAGGVRSLQALLDVVDHDAVEERVWSAVVDPGVFADLDTPDDAVRLGVELVTGT